LGNAASLCLVAEKLDSWAQHNGGENGEKRGKMCEMRRRRKTNRLFNKSQNAGKKRRGLFVVFKVTMN